MKKLSLILFFCLSTFVIAEVITPDQLEFFETRIRPVLVENCYECHNSRETAEAGLAIDWRGGMQKGGDRGRLYDTKRPSNSLLLKVMRHEIEGLEMPESGPKLAQAIVSDFERWIKMGLPDPRDQPPSADELANATSWESIRERRKGWWSFQPIANITPPIGDANHEVDRFIQRRLAESNLTPAPPADRLTLIRRAALVLTGLPPTLEEVDSFLADADDDAFEGVVDRMIASPAFGERWARHWMDWMRYAESHGSEGDPKIENAWYYRDYLIRALNADVPYDQLIREHVAGDLLENPRINTELGINESLIGTTHWRMVFHGFAPTDALDEKVRFTDDQIDTFSKAFLGLTISCARCHNHKFDAISQADYYALFGILGSTRPGRSAIEAMDVQRRHMDRLAELKPLIRTRIAETWLNQLDQVANMMTDADHQWEGADKMGSLMHPLHLLVNVKNQSSEGFAKQWQVQRDAWIKESDSHSKREGFVRYWDLANAKDAKEWYATGVGISNRPSPAGEFSLYVEGDQVVQRILPAGLHSGTLSTKHAARLASAAFEIGEDEELWLRVDGGGSAMTRYVVQNYPRNGTVFPVKNLDDKQSGQWRWHRYSLTYWQGDMMHVELSAARDAPLLTRGNDRSWFSLREVAVTKKGRATPGENQREFLRSLYATEPSQEISSRAGLAKHYHAVMKQAIEGWRDGRITDADALMLDRAIHEKVLANGMEELSAAKELVGEYRRLESEVPVAKRVPTLAEWQGQDQALYVRGNHKKPSGLVPRRFLESIDASPYKSQISGRLELADDMLREDNPFTRRVIVNRIWHYLFGAGLVESVDNLGRMGAKPSHPELLDFLARKFETEGWSLKRMIRYLVMSQTWQQSSQPTAMATTNDPQNRLCSHASVRRMDAEAIRDAMLAADGRLDRQLYGSPVRGDSNRRGVYVNVIRNRLDPFLQAFNAPVPFGTKGRRDATNVPAQSLLMMNDPFVIGSARELAEVSAKAADSTARIEMMWRRALGRKPRDSEVAAAHDFVNDIRLEYRNRDERSAMARKQIAKLDLSISEMLKPVRQRMIDEQTSDSIAPVDLNPVAVWDFETDAKDTRGKLDCQLRDGAKIEEGALVLDGTGWASTGSLPGKLHEKSLEVTVQLSKLNQRGGGVITVQDKNGVKFDSIVIGEQQERHWLAGSDGFSRTQPFGGNPETEAQKTPVHLVMTYSADGTTTLYRNGEKYGAFKKGIQSFDADNSQVIFGMRHGTSRQGGRMLRGRIFSARLYDRSLTVGEVKAASSGVPYIRREDVEAKLTEAERNQLQRWRMELAELNAMLNSFGESPRPDQAWTDLAHSLYNLKEFVYVR